MPHLTPQEDINKFFSIISKEFGIKLSYSDIMRLRIQVRQVMDVHGCANFADLNKYLANGDSHQIKHDLLSSLTTNETQFMRDPQLFKLLKNNVLYELSSKFNNSLNVWSAACSTGQEVYSLLFTLKDFNYLTRDKLDFKITGTDIDKVPLHRAEMAIYHESEIKRGLAKHYILDYFDKVDDYYQLKEEFKGYAKFKNLNLMSNFWTSERYHLVLCRNVLIYFGAQARQKILKNMENQIVTGGYLVLGGSESINNDSLKFRPINFPEYTIYEKIEVPYKDYKNFFAS